MLSEWSLRSVKDEIRHHENCLERLGDFSVGNFSPGFVYMAWRSHVEVNLTSSSKILLFNPD